MLPAAGQALRLVQKASLKRERSCPRPLYSLKDLEFEDDQARLSARGARTRQTQGGGIGCPGIKGFNRLQFHTNLICICIVHLRRAYSACLQQRPEKSGYPLWLSLIGLPNFAYRLGRIAYLSAPNSAGDIDSTGGRQIPPGISLPVGDFNIRGFLAHVRPSFSVAMSSVSVQQLRHIIV
jgi:hypothetical protein